MCPWTFEDADRIAEKISLLAECRILCFAILCGCSRPARESPVTKTEVKPTQEQRNPAEPLTGDHVSILTEQLAGSQRKALPAFSQDSVICFSDEFERIISMGGEAPSARRQLYHCYDRLKTELVMTNLVEYENAVNHSDVDVKALCDRLRGVCTSSNANAVASLLDDVSEIIDAYECSSADRDVMSLERTRLTASLVRAVEGYWIKADIGVTGGSSDHEIMGEIDRFYFLNAGIVDLLDRKVGNYNVTSSLDINLCATLKWLAHQFGRSGKSELKDHVNGLVEKWMTTRYDEPEGNSLKAACEQIEYHASQTADRNRLHPAVRSRLHNLSMDKAVRVVGRYPKWAEEWLEKDK